MLQSASSKQKATRRYTIILQRILEEVTNTTEGLQSGVSVHMGQKESAPQKSEPDLVKHFARLNCDRLSPKE